MNRKRLIAMLATITILTTLIAPMFFVSLVKAADPEDWYMTVSGVLDSDYYTLYPYANKSLNIGFSKFGELVAYDWVTETGVGLEYDGTDPFCNEDIDVTDWMEGWFMDIKYAHPVWGNREVWAFALFSDATAIGGNWTTVPEIEYDDALRPHWQEWPPFASPAAGTPGGRKTNGYATTDPIKILYDGPRRFIALLHTRISDYHLGAKKDLVDLYITVIFNKVKKTVLLLKDIKRIPKYNLDIEFSERGEWDLGPGPSSYVHFYTDGGSEGPLEGQYTCYGDEWHLDTTIPHSYAVAQMISSDADYVAAVAHWPHPDFWDVAGIEYMVVPISRLAVWEAWDVDSGHTYPLEVNKTNTLIQMDDIGTPVEPTIPWVIAEYHFTLRPEVIDQYRVAAAYILTDYHDALDDDITDIDVNKIDREIMYQLDEIFNPWDLWDALHKETKRWVEIFEAETDQYIFELPTSRMVEEGLMIPTLPVAGAYWLDYRDWDAYSTFAERVLVDGELIARYDPIYDYHNLDPLVAEDDEHRPFYYIDFWSGIIVLQEWSEASEDYVDWELEEGTRVKVLWSSYHYTTEAEVWYGDDVSWRWPLHHDVVVWMYGYPYTEVFYIDEGGSIYDLEAGEYVVCNDTLVLYADPPYYPAPKDCWVVITNITTAGVSNPYTQVFLGDGVTTEFPLWKIVEETVQVYATATPLVRDVDYFINYTTGELLLYTTPSVDLLVIYQENGTKTWKKMENSTGAVYYDLGEVVVDYSEIVYESCVELDEGDYVINPTPTCDELILGRKWKPGEDSLLRPLPVDTELKIIFEVPSGRYEWTTVGRDAHSVDSIGAAFVTAAIKNKGMEIGNAGMGMNFTEAGLSSVPYIMRNFGTAPGTRTDYKDNGSTPGDRTALRDDWCETWPIASSNILSVGGPLANLFALYLNDFTSAFYGNDTPLYGEEYTPYETWAGNIAALTCWNRTGYAASEDLGYATIGTYKDINGTVGLVIWGIRGRDTFYASQWFDVHKFELQHINKHVTSIILEIDYEDPQHPEFEIVEHLGTISEKEPIHPDP